MTTEKTNKEISLETEDKLREILTHELQTYRYESFKQIKLKTEIYYNQKFEEPGQLTD